jgi:hypothetical protein
VKLEELTEAEKRYGHSATPSAAAAIRVSVASGTGSKGGGKEVGHNRPRTLQTKAPGIAPGRFMFLTATTATTT